MIEQGQASPERQVHLLQQVPPAFSIVLVRPHQPFEGPGVPVGHLSVEILLLGRGFHLSEVVAGGAAILHTFLEKSRGRDAKRGQWRCWWDAPHLDERSWPAAK